MATSDSEEFESADESHPTEISGPRTRRRSKKSSSNYDSEDSALAKPPQVPVEENITKSTVQAETDGWDDFDIEEETETQKSNETQTKTHPVSTSTETNNTPSKSKSGSAAKHVTEESGDGWDKFDDWGDGDANNGKKIEKPKEEEKIKEVAEKLSSLSTEAPVGGGGGWGWGAWGVDSLLSTASAGISTLTNTVSQGITTVSSALESGLGAPEPEDLARRNRQPETPTDQSTTSSDAGYMSKSTSDDQGFAGSLISGVSHITKFVESTGTKVISGGLDTLETIGKKTMQVLQDGDPKLAKKRAMLGLDSGDKPILSQVLREAKTRADEEDRVREQRKEAKEVHYETLFDDFEGLVHLEALEMLSRQVKMRIEEKLRSASPEKRRDLQETMQQVAELCELSDSDDEDNEVATDKELSKPETLHNKLREATRQLGFPLHIKPLVQHYAEMLERLASLQPPRAVYKQAVGGLARATAAAVELYHKAGEMLLVRSGCSTCGDSDALAQMTSVLTRHIAELATEFTSKLSETTENKEEANGYITNIFLEAENSSTYIQNAFQLMLPILQIGAI